MLPVQIGEDKNINAVSKLLDTAGDHSMERSLFQQYLSTDPLRAGPENDTDAPEWGNPLSSGFTVPIYSDGGWAQFNGFRPASNRRMFSTTPATMPCMERSVEPPM